MPLMALTTYHMSGPQKIRLEKSTTLPTLQIENQTKPNHKNTSVTFLIKR